MRVRGPNHVELTVTLDAETVELLEEWKALTSHANPEGRTGEALRAALKVAVERARKQKGMSAGARSEELSVQGGGGSEASPPEAAGIHNTVRAPLHAREVALEAAQDVRGKLPAAIPIALRRLVWVRDQGRCTYLDRRSGRRCDGRHYLEIDHITPRAQGGLHELRNLRLLCGGHHRLRHLESG